MTTYTDSNCNVVKNITLAGLMFLSFVLAVFTNFYIASDGYTGNIPSMYDSPIMCGNWVFNLMWCIAYIFSFVWILYLCILSIKFASRESLFSNSFYLSYILVNICNCTIAYFMNDAAQSFANTKFIMYSSISCFIADISLYWVLFQSMVTLLSPVHTGLLPEWVTNTMRKLLIILLCNSIAFYVGWMTYLCNLIFALSLEYYWDVDGSTASFIALSAMTLFIVLYSVVNFVWLDVYFASIYTMFPAFIVSLIGVITEQGVSGENGASIMATVVLGVTSLLFIAKIVVNCIKAKKKDNYGILDYGYDMATI